MANDNEPVAEAPAGELADQELSGEALVKWWRAHILGPDKQCGAFLSEQGMH